MRKQVEQSTLALNKALGANCVLFDKPLIKNTELGAPMIFQRHSLWCGSQIFLGRSVGDYRGCGGGSMGPWGAMCVFNIGDSPRVGRC